MSQKFKSIQVNSQMAITPVRSGLQNQWQSSFGSYLAQLWLVGLASTNTGRSESAAVAADSNRFAVGKSVTTLDILSSRVKKVLMLCKFLARTTAFFSWEMEFRLI